MKEPRPPTDMRNTRREFNRHAIALVIGCLFLFGVPLIYFAYGPTAAVMSALCMLGGAGIILLVWFILSLIAKWVGED